MLAVDLVGEVGEPGDVVGEALRLDLRLEQGLALLPGQQVGDLLHLGVGVGGGLVEDLGALRGRQPAPALLCPGGRLRRPVDVLRPARRDLVDDLTGGRVHHVVGLAGGGLNPLPLDDHRGHSHNSQECKIES